jgi:hypothetical protein
MATVARLASAAAAVALIASGCGGGKADYPEKNERAFLDNCERTSEGNTKFCKCALDKIEENFSFDEFKKEEAAIAAGNPPSRKVTDAISDCRS